MFVIEVIPLGKNTILETLSYFSATDYPIGTFLTVPIRNKDHKAMVTKTAPVSATKTALRAATFSLKKLPEQKITSTLPAHLIKTVEIISQTYPITAGAFLEALLPPDVKNDLVLFPSFGPAISHEDSTPTVLLATYEERTINYQSIVRGAFAHRGSVILVVPNSYTVEKLHKVLAHGIEDRVACFHPYQNKSERTKAYETFNNLSHSALIITTPSHAYLDRPDITHIIIEEAGSPYYQTSHRPLFDHRQVLITLAKVTKRAIILADTVVRSEDEHKRREDIFLTYNEEQRRLTPSAKLTVIEQTKTATGDAPFRLFSPELKKRIENTIEARKNVFLFSARRGLAPVVYCIDCGHIFLCPDSGTPYSLMRTFDQAGAEQRWFVSSTSGRRVRAADTCPDCGSWRLRERGIGIQHIEDECRKIFPTVPLTIFDHTTATTHKKAVKLTEKVAGEKGHILLGTSLAVPYLPSNIHLSAIVSLDATRAIPTWRADEMLFKLLMSLRETTIQEVIVQTRTGTDELLVNASRGAIDRFYDEEIALRKMANYPPFNQFVFISWQGQAEAVKNAEGLIKMLLEKHHLKDGQIYSNPKSTPDKILRHCLIKLPTLAGQENLINDLRSLPPYFTIAINPDRIV